jgi:RNA polymerase sigma-70 factor, ECF subfamily
VPPRTGVVRQRLRHEDAVRGLDAETERALVRAAQGGDGAAFDRLVRQYQDYVYRLMVRACHHPQDAEEVASEAFVRAYERLCQFEGRSSFVSWLGRIATNLCFRRREKHEAFSVSLDERLREEEGRVERAPRATGPSPEQSALQDEMKRKIRAAVADLPEPDQTVLRLRDIEQYSAAETAERTGLTVPAVKARLHRARAQLRERLNAYFLEEA